MSEKYSEIGGGNQTRVGAPFSSRNEGVTHPGGRHDVSYKPAGLGLDHIHADIQRRLKSCGSVEEATKLGVSQEIADDYFSTEGGGATSER